MLMGVHVIQGAWFCQHMPMNAFNGFQFAKQVCYEIVIGSCMKYGEHGFGSSCIK